MDYMVRTEVFEGPFDLLLHLIARQQVDIWQVSLSRITEDYLGEIRRMRELNLEVATEFLVVAATLLELKAARLLPSPDGEEDEVEALLEERDLLFARLLQYRAYKHVAELFGARLAEQGAFLPRRAGGQDLLERIAPNLLTGVRPEDLARLAAGAFTPTPVPQVSTLLALLELYKRSLIELEQTATFGAITVRWTGHAGAETDDLMVEEPA